MDFLGDDFEGHFSRVDALTQGVFESENALVREVGAYLCLAKGKKLRPVIVILAAQACGRTTDEDVLRLAAAIELLHVATLLHDDVIDQAPTRRGRPSVNAKWSDSVAILIADYLYSSAFDLALRSLEPESLRVLCHATLRMCEGELFQIEREGQLLSREEYLKIIENKTALLFSASASLGGAVARGGGQALSRLGLFGLNFGMAFQITDDLLDYAAEDAHWGKPVGGDAAGGKQTLPLIHALEVASPEDRSTLLSLLNNGRDFAGILKHVEKYNGLDHARDVARDYAVLAGQALDGWAGNGQADVFRQLCDYVVARSY